MTQPQKNQFPVQHVGPTPCKYLDEDQSLCKLASYLANEERATTIDDCKACNRTTHPRDTNEVVLALSGISTDYRSGPGTTLHNILTWFNPKPEDCACANRVHVMNAWGPERCLDELSTILGWLRESALDAGYPYSEYAIAAVVRAICRHHIKKNKINDQI